LLVEINVRPAGLAADFVCDLIERVDLIRRNVEHARTRGLNRERAVDRLADVVNIDVLAQRALRLRDMAPPFFARGREHIPDKALRGTAWPVDVAEAQRNSIDAILPEIGVHQTFGGDLRCAVD